MNPTILYLTQALAMVPQILAAVQSLEAAGAAVKAHIDATSAALAKMQAENRDPTAEEWAAQAATIIGLRARLHDA